MNRRQFFGAAGALAGGSLASRCGGFGGPPNIVLILLDDLGIGDVSCYGGDIETPQIDGIARRGLQFEHFYASSAVCTPSRYGLLTGRYPVRAPEAFLGPLMGGWGAHQAARLDAEEVTLADMLQARGYRTGLIGKWHLGHGSPEFGPVHYGFDFFYGYLPGCIDYNLHTYQTQPALYRNDTLIQEEGYFTDLATAEAIRFIEASKEGPFFLYLAHAAPHYGKTPGGDVLQARPDFHVAHPDVTRREVYEAMVQAADEGIGLVLEALERNGLTGNTLVIFLSDNGGSLQYGGHNGKHQGEKATLWEGGIKVPCLMQWPGHIPAGATIRQFGSNVDLMPTLAELTGARLPERELDGIDLSDALTGEAKPVTRTILFKHGEQEALISGQWKYLRDEKTREQFVFNLGVDPYEQNNLASAMPAKARELLQAHFAEMERTRRK